MPVHFHFVAAQLALASPPSARVSAGAILRARVHGRCSLIRPALGLRPRSPLLVTYPPAHSDVAAARARFTAAQLSTRPPARGVLERVRIHGHCILPLSRPPDAYIPPHLSLPHQRSDTPLARSGLVGSRLASESPAVALVKVLGLDCVGDGVRLRRVHAYSSAHSPRDERARVALRLAFAALSNSRTGPSRVSYAFHTPHIFMPRRRADSLHALPPRRSSLHRFLALLLIAGLSSRPAHSRIGVPMRAFNRVLWSRTLLK
ncbi:hypothetical protein DFH09DRAFT_1457445 [Mycena vulgaris]|nr:hypothetical protein DFH09DRAFT_1457445 [Mycena vulgaris]